MNNTSLNSRLLTRRQITRLTALQREGHKVVGDRSGSPIVQAEDGQLLLVQPNGRVAATTLIDRVQSYLHVGRG